MPGTAGQYVALGEQNAAAQVGWRSIDGVQGEVDITLFCLAGDARRLHLDHGDAGARCGAAQTGQSG